MSISKWFFAEWYDLLNSVVESKVIPYRQLTAGKSLGDTLEVGSGTGKTAGLLGEEGQHKSMHRQQREFNSFVFSHHFHWI